MRGINLANPNNLVQKSIFASSNSNANAICIFLSHISEDKDAVVKIGNYIQDAGYNIYLDIYDEALNQAVKSGNPDAITKSIEKGLEYSSHVMCIVSEETVKSWWVPYEIGFGKRSRKPLSTLTLKNTITIPSYLEITYLIRGTAGLNEYLMSLSKQSTLLNKSVSNFVELNKHSIAVHPLDAYLDWQK
ncbi:toll/interleukin-1 receptor domain-containing protein [Niallia sp. JL1B1071]|uniref:toll/interleukin-1 receptor domain-containing protein n=1 Tax=Niallia tiangongensis TaxID=3237105 RepID=UPI0037DDC648